MQPGFACQSKAVTGFSCGYSLDEVSLGTFSQFRPWLQLPLLISPGTDPAVNEKVSINRPIQGCVTVVEKHRCNCSNQHVQSYWKVSCQKVTHLFEGDVVGKKEKKRKENPLGFIFLACSSSGCPVGTVSFVRLDLGREDYHSGGWKGDHHRVGGPAG